MIENIEIQKDGTLKAKKYRTRVAKMFGREGWVSPSRLTKRIVEKEAENLEKEIKDRGWLIIGTVSAIVNKEFDFDRWAVSAKAVFVGKKKVLNMSPVHELPKTIKLEVSSV